MISPGYDGFCDFAKTVGLELEDFQRQIAQCLLGHQTEAVVLLPRGQGKSRLAGTLAVHHLLTEPKAAVYVAAASREQASIVFAYARDVAQHPAVTEMLTVRHLELRAPDGGRLKVLASDAPRLHGLTPSLCIVDELHAFRDAEVYLALRTALLKRPGAKLWTISTAGQGEDSPLGKLRARGLSMPNVVTTGAMTATTGDDFALLEWAVPADQEATADAAKAANPATWISVAGLRSQREALPDPAWRRIHCGQWTQRAGAFLPEGAVEAIIGAPEFEPGEEIWVGCDVGGSEAATAVVWVNKIGNVGCWVETAEDAILRAVEKVRELHREFRIAEFVYDPWRARQAALELEQDGVRCVEFPQTDVRMVPASASLRAAVVEKRLTLPDDAELRHHFANAIAQHSRRGWRIASPGRGIQIDAVIALTMANERREFVPEPVRLLAWL